MDINELLQEKREAILQLAAKHGARNVRVFGSVARHEANEQSDIDFLVDMEPGRSLMDHRGITHGPAGTAWSGGGRGH